MSKHRTSWVAVAAVSSLLLATACGGGDEAEAPAAEASSESAAAAPSPEGGTEIDSPTADGGTESAEIIQGEVPEDIPTFPEAEPAASMLIPGRGGLVTFSTDSAVEDIVAFYKEALPEKGWKIENVSEAKLRTRITATKGDRQTDVVAARNGDSTEILISIREGA